MGSLDTLSPSFDIKVLQYIYFNANMLRLLMTFGKQCYNASKYKALSQVQYEKIVCGRETNTRSTRQSLVLH